MNVSLFCLLVFCGLAFAKSPRDDGNARGRFGGHWWNQEKYVSEKHTEFYRTAEYLLHGYWTLLDGGYGAEDIASLSGLRRELFRHIIDINATELTVKETRHDIAAKIADITGSSLPEPDSSISKRRIYVIYHKWIYRDILQTVFDLKKENLFIVSQRIDQTFHLLQLFPHFLRIHALVEDLILNQLINPKLRNSHDIWTGDALMIENAEWYPEFERKVEQMLLKVENRLKLQYDSYDKNGQGTSLNLIAYYRRYNVQQPDGEQTPATDLETKRMQYVLKQSMPGLPPMADDSVNPEKYETVYQLEIGLFFSRVALRLLWNGFNLQIKAGLFEAPPAWRTLADFEEEYHRNSVLDHPYGYFRKDGDEYFGHQRLAGPNSNLIKLATSIPEKFNVTDEIVEPFLEGHSLEDALKANRIFIVDFEMVKDIQAKPGFWFSAPIALFYEDNGEKLMPIAIQLQQEKGSNNPVFVPSDDKWTWFLAKMWFNNVDAVYHEVVTHLGLTHVLMEGVDLVTHRQLSESHPLFKLLLPHFRFLFPVNRSARRTILTPGGLIDASSNIGITHGMEMMSQRIQAWTLYEDGDLLEDLKSRKVDITCSISMGDQGGLREYPYRDDGILIWGAIKNYVTEYVNFYYATDSNVTEDALLGNWYEELTRSWDEGGVGMKVLPDNPSGYTTKDQLIGSLTAVIFICSAQHAATNFPQWDEYGYPPFYPFLLRGTPPMDKSPRTEQDVLDALPERISYNSVLRTASFLAYFHSNSLGDFEDNRIDADAQHIVEGFRSELKRISRIVKLRNLLRDTPYTSLDPENIPNALQN